MSKQRDSSFSGTDRFEYIRKLGEGAMGAVFLVFDRELNSKVALKILPEVDPPSLFRFKREFRSLIELEHPNLVNLYELVSENKLWFFTMQHVEGVDFLEYLKDQASSHVDSEEAQYDQATILFESMDGEETTDHLDGARHSDQRRLFRHSQDLLKLQDAFCQLADGIHAIHQAGKLHRDIKPKNILVQADGRVVILDFGLITELESSETTDGETESSSSLSFGGTGSSDKTISGTVVGTVAYMSPEQAANQELTAASDWYSFGVILFVALTGRYPINGTPREIFYQKQLTDPPLASQSNPNVQKHLDDLCRQLLSRQPQDRPTYEEIIQQLSGEKHQSTDKERTPTSSLLPKSENPGFLGRNEQLNQLRASYEKMRSGNMVTVTVTGRSGVGKSYLIKQFLNTIPQDESTVILSGRCFEQESVPYKTLDTLMDAVCRYLHSRTEDELSALLPRNITAVARLFPILDQIESIAKIDSNRLSKLLPQELRKLAFRAWNELIARIGDSHPLILYIDDLQWGDRDSVEAFRELIDNQSDLRVLLILSFREEDPLLPEYAELIDQMTYQQESGRHYSLCIEPFEESDALHLAKHYLGSILTPDCLKKVISQSEGNPYFIEAISLYLREMMQRGKNIEEVDLDNVLHDRVSRLDAQSREFLETMAVAGKPTQLSDLLDSMRILQDPQSVIMSLQRKRFIRSTGVRLNDSIMFYHDKILASIQSRLTQGQKKVYHSRLAETLMLAETVEPEVLAIHQRGAGDEKGAGESFIKAAQQSAGMLAFEHATSLYQQAFETHPGFGNLENQYRLEYAEALANAGMGFESANQFLKISDQTEGDQQKNARESAATQFCVSGHTDKGRELFQLILNEYGVRIQSNPILILLSLLWQRFRLKLRGDKYYIRNANQIEKDQLDVIDLLWNAASGLSFQEPVVVASLQSRGLRMALEAGEPTRLIRAFAWEAVLTSTAGPAKDAETERLLSVANSLTDILETEYAEGMLKLGRGTAAFLQVRMQDALDLLVEAEKHFTNAQVKAWWELASTRSLIVWIHMHLGNYRNLKIYTNEYFKDAESRGDRFVMANLGSAGKPQVLLAEDQPEKAELEVQKIIDLFPYRRFHQQHVSLLFSQAEIDLYQMRGGQAWRRLSDNWNRLRKSMQLFNYFTRVQLTDLSARTALSSIIRENNHDAMKSVTRSLKSLRRENARYSEALVSRIEAGIAESQDNSAAAIAHLHRAASQFQSQGFHHISEACRWRIGSLQNSSEGDAMKLEATKELESRGIKNVEKMQRTMLY